tara:strand:+ start:591 stop:878 length:288 start_codon:yes stop_codon:yes gene_type:complete
MTQNNKKQKSVKTIRERTREERQMEIRPIIQKLSELGLTTESGPVKELYKQLQVFINKGERMTIDIPFESVGRTIRGVLASDVKEEVWIKLAKND